MKLPSRHLGVLVALLVAISYANAEPKIYYVHGDHLGTPKFLTDGSQVIVWKAEHQPFGSAGVDEDPDNDGVSVEFNVRFPGQYFDQESGLNYNYYRDYDPGLGRYIQSDPIGLRGGLNTYGYVFGNPLSWIDPYGLYVQSQSNGRVTRSGYQNSSNPNAGLGYRVTVTNADGSYDQYGHMDPSTTPPVGAEVKKGDYMGEYANPTNGSSTGPHVHHERRDANGNIINPGSDPVVPGGRESSGYGQKDGPHPGGHQGRDWVEGDSPSTPPIPSYCATHPDAPICKPDCP